MNVKNSGNYEEIIVTRNFFCDDVHSRQLHGAVHGSKTETRAGLLALLGWLVAKYDFFL